MELLTKVISLESCLMIYSYLMVFGKTTPSELRDVTGQSKATMFRNLALLSDAGVLKKLEDNSVEDKRYSLHYYLSKNLFDLTKQVYSSKVRDYAISKERSDLITEWLNSIESLPFLLNQFTSQMIMLMAKRPVSESDATCHMVSKFLVFRLGDLNQVGELHKRLADFVKDFDSRHADAKRDWKMPLTRPVSMSINVVALNPEDVTEDSALVVEQIRC
ncbi:MAG: hypothetical protein ACXABZ_11705 [Candidatus Thorarchaeota archaeon]|jgi:hypothetical protein